jgi:hypothetical protein
MSPLAWIISLAVFAGLFWIVFRRSTNGSRHKAVSRENSELRHVVTELSLEKHRRHPRG